MPIGNLLYHGGDTKWLQKVMCQVRARATGNTFYLFVFMKEGAVIDNFSKSKWSNSETTTVRT